MRLHMPGFTDDNATTSRGTVRVSAGKPHRTRRHLALFVAGSDGSNPTRITDWLGRSTCCTARYSPDGTVIAYGSGGKVRTAQPDGTPAGPIPIDVGKRIQYAFGPSWSPDGTKLVVPIFISPSFSIELFVTDADGSNPQMITAPRIVTRDGRTRARTRRSRMLGLFLPGSWMAVPHLASLRT